MAKPDIHAVWGKVRDATVLQTQDGRYIFWPCERTQRWRWSQRDWPDDGIGGIPAHGAARTLPAALEASEAHRRNVDELAVALKATRGAP